MKNDKNTKLIHKSQISGKNKNRMFIFPNNT